MANEFKLPTLGEDVQSGTITKVLVSPGDSVSADQPVLELETDKAVLEVPSTVSGTVEEIRAQEGQTISVGDTVFLYTGGGEGDGGKAAAAAAPAAQEEEQKEEASASGQKEQQPAPSSKEETKDEAKEDAKQAKEPPARKDARSKAEAPPAASAQDKDNGSERKAAPRRSGPVPAPPSVRRLAREIGVDIHEVPGSGPQGRISAEDVKSYARQVNTDVRGMGSAGRAAPLISLPDFSRWGDTERSTLGSVRRRTAENMSVAWTAPMVTQFDKVDVTELEKLRKRYGKQVEAAGGKLTVTAMIVKVLGAALKKFPQFNSSLDMDNDELIYKRYYNVGVAVDTDRGLLVPVLRDVDTKSITEICVELSGIAARARERKLSLEEMQGGTFTVSNLGGIGGTGFTPIVNAPEVAILGIARASVEPVYQEDGRFEPRTMLPLALTYDHRVIDGADGARFVRFVADVLEQPFLLFLEA